MARGGSDGSVVIDTALDNRGFIKGIRGMAGQADGLRSAVKRLGTVITAAFAVKAVVDFGRQAVRLGSDVAEVQNVVDVAFGELRGQAEDFAQTAITRFGMSALSAKKTASTYMAMAKGMGLASQEAADMAITLAGLSGDVASFFNISQELADIKLKSVFTGETETLKDLGVVMTQDNLKAYALSKGFRKSYDAMSQAEKVALRYRFVLDSLALANGDFARTQDSWANQTRILSMQWQEFMGILGQSIITVLKPVVKWLNAVVSHMIALATMLNNTVTKAFGGETKQAEATSAAIGSSVENQENLTDAVKDTNKAQQKSLAGFDEINQLAGDAAGSASGVGGGVDLSDAAIEVPEVENVGESLANAEIEALQDALRRIGEVFRESWELNSSAVIEASKRTLTSMYELLKSIGTAFTEAWTGGAGLEFLNAVYELLATILNIIADIAEAWKIAFANVGIEFFESVLFRFTEILKLINSVGEAFREAWNDGTGVEICETILQIYTNINNIVGTFAQKIRETWEANGNGVAVWNAVLDIVQTVLDFIERITASTLEWVQGLDLEPVIGAFRGLLEAIAPLVEVITGGLAYAYENVLLPFGRWFLEELAPVGIELVTAAIEALTEILETLEPFGTWLWETFLQPLAAWTGDIVIAALETIIRLLNGFSQWVSENQGLVQGIAIVIGSFAAAWGLVNTAVTLWSAISAAATAATTAFGAAVAFLTSPIGLVTVAIGAVIAVVVLLMQHWDAVKEAAGKAWDFIVEKWNAAAEWFSANVVEPIKQFFSGLWAAVRQLASQAWTGIQGIWSAVSGWFQAAVIQPVTGTFTGMWNGIGQAAAGIWQAVQNVWSAAAGWFSQHVTRPLSSAFDTAGGAIKGTINGLLSNVEGMLNAVIRGVNWLISQLNKVSFDVPDWLGGGKFGISIPKISETKLPRLAQGAVIPPNREFMAVLGDQTHGQNLEGPEDMFRKIVREESRGGDYSAVLQAILEAIRDGRAIMVDRRVLGQVVTQEQNRMTRQSGRSVLLT